MTRRIYTVEEIELQDWETPIRIFPLTIKKFRKVAETLDKLNPDKTPKTKRGEKEPTFLDILLEATAICMETYEPKLTDPEELADHIDVPTMEYVLEIAIGVKLNDPNPQAAIPMAGMS